MKNTSNDEKFELENIDLSNEREIYKNVRYAAFVEPFSNANLSIVMDLIETRFRDLENKVFKKKNERKATRAQKVLLLHHLGMLKPLMDLDISPDNKATLLKLILNEDWDNLYGDISDAKKSGLLKLRNAPNYKFLLEVFEEAKLDKLSRIADDTIHDLINEKEDEQIKKGK